MAPTKNRPKDTHWPPEGVRDLPTREPKNSGPLVVTLGALLAARKAKQG